MVPSSSFQPRILVAPLDWGLGHATRCIPIIRELTRQNALPVLAGSGPIEKLLRHEFPELPFIQLKGYEVEYSASRWTLPFVMASQIPKLIAAIQYENERLQEIVIEQELHGVISDNRYGLYHPALTSVFITHQLLIRTGLGRIADEALQDVNYDYINRFNACWVPDWEGEVNLAGQLSHPEKKPAVPLTYLGPLSRFTQLPLSSDHLLILLSGPEPQRTILEELLLEQLKAWEGSVVLARGLPQATETLDLPQNIEVYNHLPSEALNRKMASASYVISRCGYSTVMDLALLQKKSILIPTPGQTEQEYLARHLMANNFAFSVSQEKFRLKSVLELASNFTYRFPTAPHSPLPQAVSSLLEMIAGMKRP